MTRGNDRIVRARLGAFAGALGAAVLFGAAPGSAAAQQPCVEAPLFSGNVALPSRINAANFNWKASSMVVGRFDADANYDLVLGDTYGKLGYYRGRDAGWDFDPIVYIPLPLTPPRTIAALAGADLNDDGNLDLVLGDGVDQPAIQRIHVMLGNGDGTFQVPTSWGPETMSVNRIRVADFDGDKLLDLVCSGSAGVMPVTILWGAGDGTFPRFDPVDPHVAPSGLDAADIDRDGDIDIVVGPDPPPNPIPSVILRNNGNGTFLTEWLVFPGGYGHTFGELNGDRWPDLVIATTGDLNVIPGKVWVLMNDSTGQYLTTVSYPVTTQPEHTITGSDPLPTDLDGDERDEVVVGRQGLYSATGHFRDQLLVFRNAGDGTLEEPPALYHIVGAQASPPILAAPDLNHDGSRDLVAANAFATTLLLNDGDGGFLTAHASPMGPEIPDPSPVPHDTKTWFEHWATGDINGDERFDLAVIRQATPDMLECTVMLQDEQGAFTTIFSVPLPERQTTGLVLADFNRDDKLDMAISTQSQTAPGGGNTIRVALGNGNGTFQAWAPYSTFGLYPRQLAAGDLNGDLWPDLVIATSGSGGVSVLLNEKDGTFAPAAPYDCENEAQFVAITDVNGDTHPDLAVVAANSAGVTLFMNNGNGTFGPHGPYYYYHGIGHQCVTFADVNGDNSPDMFVTIAYHSVLAHATSGGVAVAINNGAGVFSYLTTLDVSTEYSNRSPTLVDLNADGKKDYAITEFRGTFNTGYFHIRLGNGNGTFGPRISYGGGEGPLIVADFDGDGRPDLGSPTGCSWDSDLASYVGFSRLLNRTCESVCYPDCTGEGLLTVADFGCFQGKYVLGDPYADCNESGNLTVADFGCFQGKYVLGCP